MIEQPNQNTHEGDCPRIKIRQQNLNKSLSTQCDILHQLNPNKYDVAAIQEPYLNFNHNSHATHNWYTIYPEKHYVESNKTRYLLLINKRMPSDSWFQVDFASSDVTAVQVQTPAGAVLIINTYNDTGNSDGVRKVARYMRNRDHGQGRQSQLHVVWLGDFNSHHPMWDKDRNMHLFMRSNLARAQVIIDLLANYDLQMV